MIKIGLLSDTHGYLDERIMHHFKNCEEIWHAGDIGTIDILEKLENYKTTRAVYGNIDGHKIRAAVPEIQHFSIRGLKVIMKHIGGYPGRYDPTIREIIRDHPPDLFISGHSHILKVMPDRKYKLLHINPGSAGKSGIHQVRTLVRFNIDEGKVHDLEVIELGKRV